MRKRWVWISLGVLAILIAGASFYFDQILRATIERNINRNLKGYSARIRAVSFHPIGFSLDLLDAVIVQDKHPDPPIMHVPRLHASVHWGALLHGRLVADFLFERPKLHVNLAQATAEIRDKTPMREQGWQEALESIYPLKINLFRVQDGEVTYVDQGPFRPLQITHVNLLIKNIRNVRSPDHVYPSELQLVGTVFDSGKIVLDGKANFLAEPHIGVRASLSLEGIPLDYFKPITTRYNAVVRGGTLSSTINLEYAPKTKIVNLQEVSIQDVDIEYVHKSETAADEAERAERIQQTVKQVSNNPEILLQLDKLSILKSAFSFRNEAANTPYRLFVSNTDIRLANLSNQRGEGTATGTVKGKFMGSGDTDIQLTFVPVRKQFDLDLKVQIEGTNLAAMNDLLRSYGEFDVGGGQFSFYSEVNIRHGHIEGYIKPLFKDVEISDPRTESEKEVLQKVKETILSGISWILKNRPRHEIGTTVNISGTLHSPEYSTWQAFGGLLKNAFIKPLRPGFKKDPGSRPNSGLSSGSSSEAV